MKSGEPTLCAHAFTYSPEFLGLGCESGTVKIFSLDLDRQIYRLSMKSPIVSIQSIDDYTFYVSSEDSVELFDLRIPPNGVMSFNSSNSRILDFSAIMHNFAVSTIDGDLFLWDKRNLRKPKSHNVLPSVCTSLDFYDENSIIAGYIDCTIGCWNTEDSSISVMYQNNDELVNPPVVHSISSFGQYSAAATQGGLTLFLKKKLLASSFFEHDGPVEAVTFAPCLTGNYVVSGSSDGTMMILNCQTLETLDVFIIDDERIECITANSRFIAVIDTSDDGAVGIFTPDDFKAEK